MAEPMDTAADTPQSVEHNLETVLFQNQSTSTPPPIPGRQVSRLSHPPPPIDSPVLSAAQTPSKPSPPVISMSAKEGTPVNGSGKGSAGADGEKGAGAPVRQYLNECVTPYLLEGMKILAREQPSNPLETLGRYLIQRSQTVEGPNANLTTSVLNPEPASTPGPSATTPSGTSKPEEVKMEEAP